RIQRLVIGELGEALPERTGGRLMQNRYFGSALAVFSAFLLLASADEGKGGLILWPLFGATNQLIAVLGLAAVTYWLMKKHQTSRYTALPLIFLTVIVLWAIGTNTWSYWQKGDYLLFGSQCVILLMV